MRRMSRTMHATGVNMRARYARTSGDMLLNDDKQHVWWYGVDTGGGDHPIGPNGPWTSGSGGIPAVTRATSLIIDPVVNAGWTVKDDDGNDVYTPRWVSDPQLVRPDDRAPFARTWPHLLRLPRALFWAEYVRNALWWGMSCLIYVTNDNGLAQPGSLYRLHRHAFEVTDWGTLKIGTAAQGQVETDSEGRFTVGGVRWSSTLLRNPLSPIDEHGRSFGVFDMHPDVFELQQTLADYGLSSYSSGIPAGVLKVKQPGLQQEQADELKRKWMEAHGGVQRSVAVLNATTEYQALARSIVDSDLANVKRSSLIDVANAFNLSPSDLGGPSGDSQTYANVESRERQRRVHTVARWQTDVAETLSSMLPHGLHLQVGLRSGVPALNEQVPAQLGDVARELEQGSAATDDDDEEGDDEAASG